MQVKEIVKVVHGELLQGSEETKITSFSNDTRTLEKGALYIPIIGEVFDGHTFINNAYEKGAIATFSSNRKDNYPQDLIVIYVEDTLKALQDLAHYKRINQQVKVVGITGSVGKTSTKDMIASVVSTKYKTLKTIGNYNNDIGLPLTILRLQEEEVMVLEMGMNALNEIALLSQIARPDIAVITNIGSSHIGNLGSRENILKAKLEIIDGIKQDGQLIVNGDNDLLRKYYQEKPQTSYQVICYGYQNSNEIMATNLDIQETRSSFDYKQTRFTVNVAGAHFVSNALASIAVGEALNIALEDIKKGIETFELTKNRSDILELNKGITIIDGTYNANADSMKASLDVLSNYKDRRKIAVLADMLELGEYTVSLHEEVGKHAFKKDIDMLIAIGELSKSIIKGANGLKHCYWFMNKEEAFRFLMEIIDYNDVILLKGSNAMKLKEVVSKLKEEI